MDAGFWNLENRAIFGDNFNLLARGFCVYKHLQKRDHRSLNISFFFPHLDCCIVLKKDFGTSIASDSS
jgi:hypothetical protein